MPAVSVLLPLFPDDSKFVSMIRHAMDVIWKAVQVVYPGQIPVITSTPLHYSQTDTLFLAYKPWKRQICFTFWRTPH